MQVTTSTLSYIGLAVASIFDDEIRSDMNAIGWNPFNSNENSVLKSKRASFYKGVPVFKTKNSRSGSFGAIFLSKYDDNVDDVRHERGHNWQLMMLGIVSYATMIGLPSMFEWSSREYYDRPWEITADSMGGTSRTHIKSDINRGYWYLLVSSLLGPFGYIFLLWEN